MRNRKSMPRQSAARGFTIIEILIVLVLIGVVLGIVANRMSGASVNAQVRASRISIDTLGGKIETYTLDNGTPPQNLADLVQKPGDASNWNGPYAKEAELKDVWGHEFVYRAPGTDKDFDLCSMGPDGKSGGDELKTKDICN
jgi:general secretion pathway protein G